jgi:hypothetical protein
MWWGRFLCPQPSRLVVITAHYDSARTVSWRRWPYLRLLHLALIVCMVLVLMSCIVQALDTAAIVDARYYIVVRWAAAGALLAAAAGLFLNEHKARHTRGAVHNASGTAALLGLAALLRENPPANTDVWLVATGSHETGLSGMHRLIASHEFDGESTFFIDLNGISVEPITYTLGEGLLQWYRTAPELAEAAQEAASEFAARPARPRRLPTGAWVPLARGLKAIAVTGEAGADIARRADGQQVEQVDPAAVAHAAQFTARMVYALDRA